MKLWVKLAYVIIASARVAEVKSTVNADCESLFKCSVSQRCIDKSLVCDGEYDCGPGDFTDEHCNGTSRVCQGYEFSCRDGRTCIPTVYVCDHIKDCEDGSDETQRVCQSKTCEEFTCSSGECIPKEWACDGANDCPDGSDEARCSKQVKNPLNCQSTDHHFLCANGQKCIPFDFVCNNRSDCSDGSDEGAKCSEECSRLSCTVGCKQFPDGPKCICPVGQILLGNNSCTDIDECQMGAHFGLCDQICTNFPGSYHCSCHEGFTLVDDRCKADGGEGILVFTSGEQVRALYLESNVYHVIEDNVSNPTAVAFDGDHVYYATSAIGEEAIFKTTDIGGNPESLIEAGVGLIEDLVIDWLTKNLYFSDSSYHRIVVCSNDGNNCKILFHSLDKPRGLALDPSSGIMFHTCWGDSPKIVKSYMDGTNEVDLVTKNISWPNGIAIDFGTHRLYWADAKLDVIEHINFDGSDRQSIHSEEMSHPFSLDVFEDTLYWSDLHNSVILSCNKFTGKSFKKVASGRNQLLGIHIHHPYLLKSIENPCGRASCSDMCLLRPGGSKGIQGSCACPEGMILSSNNRTCSLVSKPKDLIVGSGAFVYSMSYDVVGKVTIKEFPHLAMKVEALCFDSVSGRLIVSDTAEGTIVLYDVASKKVQKVQGSLLDRITEMDFDPLGNNLYYVNSANHTIEVMNMRTLDRIVLMKDFGGEEPIDIALFYEEGIMFIAFWDQKEQKAHIDQFKMDGTHSSRVHVVEKEIIGPRVSLHFDHYLHRLYWSDVGTGKIKSCEKDGTIVHTIRSMPKDAPADLITSGGSLFWSVVHSKNVVWENMLMNDYAEVYPRFQSFKNFNEDHPIKFAVLTSSLEHVNHSCHLDNGNCSHLCISMGSKQACLCPNDMTLDRNGFTCVQTNICQSDEYQCFSGSCIHQESACDGKPDCPDGEDESHCSSVRCYSHTFACHNGKQCVELHQRCDSHKDCDDGSDEESCEHTCSPVQFQCSSGSCIHIALRCDYQHDCPDESDEENCLHDSCDPHLSFKCASGQCIPHTWECDGEVDCTDSSDEHPGCQFNKSCKESERHCVNGHCVDKKLFCNGEDDCDDGSDETNCPETTTHRNISLVVECLPELFLCQSHPPKCLPMNVRCNGSVECENGEDEHDCVECGHEEFQCEKTRRCISKSWVCDGANDCGDHSDEKDCSVKFTGKTEEFCEGITCKDTGFCIPWEKVCDSHADCHDGSDEGGHCGDGCEHAGCTDLCKTIPSGHRCYCPPGFNLMNDGRRCVDIDECSLNTCSQLCNNTVGSYFCSCVEPYYHLKSDKTSCKARGPEMEYVFTTNRQIRLKSRSLQTVDSVYESAADVTIFGLDLDMRERVVFWSSELEGRISRIHIDDPKDQQMISGLVKPGRIAFDWVTQNVYVVERGYSLKVCNFNNKACSVIVEVAKDATIDALTVDAKRRVLFWSETHELLSRDPRSLVKKASMAGEKAMTIIESNLKKVVGIVADSVRQVIYLADYAGGKVERASYNGRDRKTIFREVSPMGLSLFEDHLYWINKIKNTHTISYILQKCGVHGKDYLECEYIRLLPQNSIDKIQSFRILQPVLQMRGVNDCEEARCEFLCIMEKSGPICLCRHGEKMNPGTMCPNNTLIFKEIHEFHTAPIRDDEGETGSNWVGWFLGILVVMAVAAGLASFLYSRYVKKDSRNSGHSVYFLNLSYDRGSSDLRLKPVTPGQHQYENPIAFAIGQSLEGNREGKSLQVRRGYGFWSDLKQAFGLYGKDANHETLKD